MVFIWALMQSHVILYVTQFDGISDTFFLDDKLVVTAVIATLF